MTDDERQQVQNLINAKIKVLSEKISRQNDEIQELGGQIIALTTALENREEIIENLKEKLSEAENKAEKLTELLQDIKPENHQNETKEPEKIIVHEEKPNYLVSLLRQHFGFNSFKPGQEEVINAILSGRDVFCSMPDNYGKSIAYRLAALLMPGLTLVITPSEPQKIFTDSHSEYLTQDSSPAKKRELLRKIKSGTCKILYSDFNQLTDPDIANALKSTEISMSILISEWGEGKFDPEKLKDYRNFISSLSTRRITSGVFANSTSPTFRKILFKIADLHSPLKIVTGFNKPDVSFKIIHTENRLETLNEILALKNNMAGIIFCAAQETVNELREKIHNEKLMILQENFYRDSYGKNINFIIHYDNPQSLGSYAQEINCINKGECIFFSSRKYLRLSERAVIEFCRDKDPKNILLSYLGEDESFTEIKIEKPAEKIEEEKILPDDFDFGTANEAQKEAVTSTNGALLISAAPGTGKTYTLIQRTVFLIQKRKVKPENIMLAAFTEKSSRELLSGVAKELSARKIQFDIKDFYAGTFYEICERILREFSAEKQVKNFKVLDDFDNALMIYNNVKKFDESKTALKIQDDWKFSCELRDYINRLSEKLIDPEELINDINPSIKALGNAMKIYNELLFENNSLSYSAILSSTYKLLRDNPEISDAVREKIRYIMIDEYQDTNYIQEQIAFLIFEGSRDKNICVAGNEDESVYSSKGTSTKNILEFPDKFAKNECKIVKLILNYRSEAGIIKFFGEWINNIEWGNFRTEKKIEAYKPLQKNYPSVMRLAGVNDKDEWHEKILSFINTLKDLGKITDYNQVALIFKSVKNGMVQELIKFLENNNVNVYSPSSNSFLYRNEIYFAIGCFISMFPKFMKSLQNSNNDLEHINYYKNCLKYFSHFINRPNYETLKKWLIEKRNFHENLRDITNYSYSDLFYELMSFKPFNNALDVNVKDTPKSVQPAKNLAKIINLIREYETSNKINAKNLSQEIEFIMNIYLRSIIEEEIKNCEDKIPSGHVGFMTVQETQGREFPIVFVDSLNSVPEVKKASDVLTEINKSYSRRADVETSNDFDFNRLFYTAFSRAEDILILTCNEDSETPGKYFETQYNKLDDADEIEIPHEEIDATKISGVKKIYSFTKDILSYEICSTQYKFYRELNFKQKPFNSLPKIPSDYINDGAAILKSNAEINLERENYILQSKVDLICMRDREAEIIIFKEGSKPNRNINSDRKRLERYTRELILDAYMTEKSLGLNVKHTKIYYTEENGDTPEVIYTYNKNEGEKIIKGIDDTVKKIIEGDFELRTSDSEVCRKCDFRFYCGRY